MFIKRLLFGLALASAGSATYAADWHKGENFLAAVMPSAEWDAYRYPNDPSLVLWKNKSNDDDRYTVAVRRELKMHLSQFRDAQDAPGEKRCARFTSTTIDEQPVNGYPRLVWRTLCIRDDGSKTSILHLIVQGRDSFYHAMKIWRFDVVDTDVDAWVARFREFLVCDTRKNRDHPCPEGAERVE